jgi:hypothetical protein
MRIPKRYGHSKVDSCPFCNKIGTVKNNQGVSVCENHKNSAIQDLKCVCGDYLDLRNGKYGAYFNCMNCGNMNMNKVLSMNPNVESKQNSIIAGSNKSNNRLNNKNMQSRNTKKEITITSDMVDVFYS